MPTGETCPKCGSMLVVKIRANGRFVACENKDCSYIKRENRKSDADKEE